MELQFKRRERMVGAFVVATTLLLLSMVVLIGRGKDWFKNYVPYYAVFKESYNLSSQADVKIAKTVIGKVRKITLSETADEVRVDLIILEEYAPRIRKGTVATVDSPTFIGSEYIAITPGPRSGDLIESGGEIASKAKKSVEDLMAEFEVQKTARKFVQAVQDISEITAELRSPEGPLFSTMDNLDRSMAHIEAILAGVDNGQGTLGGILRSEQLLEKIYASLDSAHEILSGVARMTAKGPEYDQRLQKALTTVQSILENVEAASYDVPKVTRSTAKGVDEFRQGIKGMDQVVQSIRGNPLVRGGIPPEPAQTGTEAGLRP